nr:DISARM system phospholipase D-like protein DrmC [Pseudanabaena sp. FACHB-2040]
MLPRSVLGELTAVLARTNSPYGEALANSVLQPLNNPRFRRAISDMLAAWKEDSSLGWSSRELAAAIYSAAYTAATIRQELAVELVWTGPASSGLAIRRTDQVLLQLIRECQKDLTLISFAIYKIPEIVEAIVAALNRGVSLRIVAETPESGDGKIAFGLQATFGPEIMRRSQVLIWPMEKRPANVAGKYGSLHVKGAVADGARLFITSANLTEYALSLNMEMGVLIRNQELAGQVLSQIDQLVLEAILVPLPH